MITQQIGSLSPIDVLHVFHENEGISASFWGVL